MGFIKNWKLSKLSSAFNQNIYVYYKGLCVSVNNSTGKKLWGKKEWKISRSPELWCFTFSLCICIITNCYSRMTLVDPWFAGRMLTTNGKLRALFHLVQHVDIQTDQQCLSIYHITENGLINNVGLAPVFMSTHRDLEWIYF